MQLPVVIYSFTVKQSGIIFVITHLLIGQSLHFNTITLPRHSSNTTTWHTMWNFSTQPEYSDSIRLSHKQI